jgi:hypothetical protein
MTKMPYAMIYPFVETGAGILMIGNVLTYIAAPAALIIGTIGGISVFKAVWIDKRELKCACVPSMRFEAPAEVTITDCVRRVRVCGSNLSVRRKAFLMASISDKVA